MDYELDIERLREDLKSDLQGAYYVGGFGGALMESFDVDDASPDDLISMAQNEGFNLRDYIIGS